MPNTYMTMSAGASAYTTISPAIMQPKLPQHYMETANLVMRPVTRKDTDEYALLFSDENVMRHVGLEAGQLYSREESEQIVADAVDAWSTRGWGRWSIFHRETDEFAGFCGYRSEDEKPELISMLHERFWGTGLAQEANQACLDYGFAHLGFTEVKSFCRPQNTRARGMLNKLDAEFLGMTDFHGVEGAAYRLLPQR